MEKLEGARDPTVLTLVALPLSCAMDGVPAPPPPRTRGDGGAAGAFPPAPAPPSSRQRLMGLLGLDSEELELGI